MARELPCTVNQRIIQTTGHPRLQWWRDRDLLFQLSSVVCLLTRGHLKLTRRGGWDWHPLLAGDLESFWQQVCKLTS